MPVNLGSDYIILFLKLFIRPILKRIQVVIKAGKMCCMRKLYLSLVLFSSVILLGSSDSASAARYMLLASGDWPPYSQNIEGDYGITTEIVTAVVEEMGLQTHIQWLPWKRNEALLKRGNIFAAFPYRKTSERSSQFEFSDPLIFTTTRLFFDRGRTAPVLFEKFSDLKNVLIGGVRGYSYVGDFESVGADLTVVNYDSQLVRMLASGRVDFAAMDTLGGRLLLTELLGDKQSEYQTLKKPVYSKSASRLMVSREYPGYKI